MKEGVADAFALSVKLLRLRPCGSRSFQPRGHPVHGIVAFAVRQVGAEGLLVFVRECELAAFVFLHIAERLAEAVADFARVVVDDVQETVFQLDAFAVVPRVERDLSKLAVAGAEEDGVRVVDALGFELAEAADAEDQLFLVHLE